MTCIRELAMLEPLVDTVQPEAVVSDRAALITVDIQTVTVEQLTFLCPFSLNMRRPDYVHALVAWFDIEFSHCHKPIKFSTGPHARYTHWKQVRGGGEGGVEEACSRPRGGSVERIGIT